MKISLLFDKNNNSIYQFFYKNRHKIKSKVELKTNINSFKFKDVIIALGYTKKIDLKKLKRFKSKLLIHESNLPKGRGHSPVKHQIAYLKKKKIHCKLIEISNRIDSGDIWLSDYFMVKKTDLYDDIKLKQFQTSLRLINRLIKKKKNIKIKKQVGRPTYFKKLKEIDDKININKSVKSQFDKMRSTDYKNHTNFFIINNQKIYLKLSKKKLD